MSEKKEWTRAEVMELIYSYEQHHCLWNSRSQEYKNKTMKSEAIKQLSEKFETSMDEITRKIHNLRNQFNTELKKINSKKSEQGDGNYVSKWPYFKHLFFIKSTLQTRQTIGNMLKDEDDGEEIISSEHLETMLEENTMNDLPKRKSRENSSHPLKKIKSTYDDREELPTTARSAHSNDEYDVFGSFVAEELRGLRHDFLKRKLKRGIQKLILDVAEEDEEIEDSEKYNYNYCKYN